MAVAIASSSTLPIATLLTGGNIVITKPTGLSLGDLMVAHVAGREVANSISTPSGWTIVSNASNLFSNGWYTFYKVATSGDVAASTFSFAASGTHGGGIIFRITGAPATPSIIAAKGVGAGNQGTASIPLSATPIIANSLAIIVVLVDDASDNAGTFSNYTLTGGASPTFTEQFDEQYVNDDLGWAIATAIYTNATPITAIGYDQTGGSTSTNQLGAIVLIAPLENAAGTTALLSADADFFAPAGTAGTSGTNALLSADADLFVPTAREDSPTQRWTEREKTDAAWVNQVKT